MMRNDSDRRRYPRVKAPILFRAARFRSARRPVVDVAIHGLRVYSDDAFKVGDRLDVELFLPDGDNLDCVVRVVWIQDLPQGSPAQFDVGLQILDATGGGLARLADVVDRYSP